MPTANSNPAMRRDKVGVNNPHFLHHHGRHQWSRRQFLQAGGLLLGAVAAGCFGGGRSVLAAPPGSGIPSQLPDGSPIISDFFGLEIPWFSPAEIDPFTGAFDPVANPTTIWDFNGSLGLIEANGVSTQNSEGIARRWSCDVRFMTGVFRDRTGRTQQGTFCFL